MGLFSSSAEKKQRQKQLMYELGVFAAKRQLVTEAVNDPRQNIDADGASPEDLAKLREINRLTHDRVEVALEQGLHTRELLETYAVHWTARQQRDLGITDARKNTDNYVIELRKMLFVTSAVIESDTSTTDEKKS